MTNLDFKDGDQLEGKITVASRNLINHDWNFYIATIITKCGNEFEVAIGNGFPPQIGQTICGTLGEEVSIYCEETEDNGRKAYFTLKNIQPLNEIGAPTDPFAPWRPHFGNTI